MFQTTNQKGSIFRQSYMARKVKKGYLDPVGLTKPKEISHVSMAEGRGRRTPSPQKNIL